ncbi:hypothetical protein GBF38_002513 [Nibea albiflora]|uniref:Uncharacterized protein n=1 Tax=Nibea albiflora TaxID=240163 RepID=A0ACB7EF85_NIBAL|nr:hypothetical protein GBF38_002513 [Nibea albiflora]
MVVDELLTRPVCTLSGINSSLCNPDKDKLLWTDSVSTLEAVQTKKAKLEMVDVYRCSIEAGGAAVYIPSPTNGFPKNGWIQ